MARRKDGCFHNQENRGTSKRVPPQKHVGGTSSLTEPGEPYGDLTGKLGLDPLGRDFHRQNRRNPFRCQRTSVSGFTTMRAFFQSNRRASVVIVNLVALSVRRGVRSRSTKKVSCFRRKRFSAARAPCERTRFRANAMASRVTGTNFESSRKSEPFHVQNDDGRRETTDPGRSKSRNQRRIEFLRRITGMERRSRRSPSSATMLSIVRSPPPTHSAIRIRIRTIPKVSS